eukprot:CAMPEP_0183304480 /NCGR_PEP_ID=MMETSP0160_2-20130417/9554_1 /TAXON_ID=2839 ORGANISM="Odontella Sinensis, Strain Grunow 1884" /NCGR_SAMPLE_ID=MMETSP0160_2 /ASSEMBLY_ACC=CAM_ASM_000250 /LENGTH=389 /DNA_ID=CAMNT_0025467539 /DNA_START=603 /DNA_END=1769 /DNA_ORIENTATION=+
MDAPPKRVRVRQFLRRGQQPHGDHAPNPPEQVDGNRVHGVVKPHPNQELRAPHIEGPGHEPDNNGRPGLDHGAPRRHGNEAGEAAVHGVHDVEPRLARSPLLDDELEEEGRDSSHGGGEGGVDGGKGRNLALNVGGDGEGGTGVEAVPAEPQDEGAKHLQRYGMPGKILGLLQRPPPRVVEPAVPRPQDLRRDDRRHAPRRVDHAAPREVHDAGPPKRFRREGAQESPVGPNGPRHHRVHEPRQRDRVAQVRRHLAPLRERPGHDGRRSGCERELEQPVGQVVDAAEEEVGRSHEGRFRRRSRRRSDGAGRAVREGVPDAVEAEGGAAGVQEVLEHRVADVLEADGAGAEHGEPGLHEEDQGGGVQEEEGVEARGVADGGGDDDDAAAG